MTSPTYLDMLDELLRPGIARLSARFVAAQVDFVAGCQRPDGGFGGRQGGSDPYYTDFALRALSWLAPGHAAFDRVAGYLPRLDSPPRDVVQCFSAMNVRRLWQRHSPDAAGDGAGAHNSLSWTELLYGRLLPGGGLARSADDQRVSAYHTFLGALCFQILGIDMPMGDEAVAAVETLRRPDGGYAEQAGQTASQTSATAAAVAFLIMNNALAPEQMAQTSRFLAQMQSADGGLRPHAEVAAGDLLSTYTGLLTLWGLAGLLPIDVASAARFLRRMAHPQGGFLACDGDDAADVEYTYYGVGTLALLRHLTPTSA
jgi:geranylgeranyl transferase type-2 subunit beta